MKKNVVSIILNYNDKNNTVRLSKCLEKYNIIDKIIVVDNCSPNNDIVDLMKLSSNKIDVIFSDKNGGYSYGNNYALKYIEKKYGIFKYIIISNPDIEVEEEAIKKTINYLSENLKIALAAPRIYDQNGVKYILSGWKIRKIWDDIFLQSRLTTKLFVKFPWKRMYDEKYSDMEYSVCSCVSGAFFIVKGEIFKKINYFDDKLFLFGEEDVIGKQIHDLGYDACVLNNCKVIHYESVSINRTYQRTQTLKILYKSLRHYYKKYDENVNFLLIFLYDIIYYYGRIETKINNFFNKFTILKKMKIAIKKIFHKIFCKKNKKRLREIKNNYPNNKKNILIVTNYWEEQLSNRKNIGLNSWLANDIIRGNIEKYNFHIIYTINNTYRLTSYVNNKIINLDVGYCNHKIECKNNSYNRMIKSIIKNLKIDLVHINTIINHYPDIYVPLTKQHVPYIISILDNQYNNPYFIYKNIDSDAPNPSEKTCEKWRKHVQRMFNGAKKIIFDNEYAKEKYKDYYNIENEMISSSLIDSSYLEVLKPSIKNKINIGFLGCVNNKQELSFISKFTRYCNVKNENINFYFIGNQNINNENKERNLNYIGEYSRNDLSKIVKKYKINLFCFFKTNDALSSLTLKEAYLLNIPILSFNIGFYDYFVKKYDCGWTIYKSSTPYYVYNKLNKIINNEKEYYSKLNTCKEIIDSNSIYEKIYCEVLDEKK